MSRFAEGYDSFFIFCAFSRPHFSSPHRLQLQVHSRNSYAIIQPKRASVGRCFSLIAVLCASWSFPLSSGRGDFGHEWNFGNDNSLKWIIQTHLKHIGSSLNPSLCVKFPLGRGTKGDELIILKQFFQNRIGIDLRLIKCVTLLNHPSWEEEIIATQSF